jgi:hypothetical protein
MAGDQLYCLECGERRPQMSSVLRAGPPAGSPSKPPLAPPAPPGAPAAPDAAQRNNTVTVIAGIGVLLLAMGVGVLIGRAGSAKQVAAPAQVISVASTPGGAGGAAPAPAASFTGDWPAGTKGYTVQLQTLPASGMGVSAVAAAKTAASAKGAKAVGALKSDEFSSLPAGHYVIYSGVYHTKAEASKALAGLKKSFPSASVIAVSSASSASSEESAGSSSSGGGANLNHPAPPTVLKTLRKGGGQSYEQKSKNLPNVIETG